jgi:hypothetical protein
MRQYFDERHTFYLLGVIMTLLLRGEEWCLIVQRLCEGLREVNVEDLGEGTVEKLV